MISVSLALSQALAYTAQPMAYGASASRGVPVYVQAVAGTHCGYPRRDGQGELTKFFDWDQHVSDYTNRHLSKYCLKKAVSSWIKK